MINISVHSHASPFVEWAHETFSFYKSGNWRLYLFFSFLEKRNWPVASGTLQVAPGCCEAPFFRPSPEPHPAVGGRLLLVSSPEFGSKQARFAFPTENPLAYFLVEGLWMLVISWGFLPFVRAKRGLRKYRLISWPQILKVQSGEGTLSRTGS